VGSVTAPELRELARQIRTAAAEVSHLDAAAAVTLNDVARMLVARADRLELPAWAQQPERPVYTRAHYQQDAASRRRRGRR
jgi:hypothetical protein